MAENNENHVDLQGNATNTYILKRIGAKDVVTQADEEDPNLVHKRRKHKRKHGTTQPRNALNKEVISKEFDKALQEVNRSRPGADANHEKPRLLAGVVGSVRKSISVDLRAYRNQLETMKREFQKNGQTAALEQIAFLINALDRHKQLTNPQLSSIYQSLGESAVPENVAVPIREQYAMT